MFATNEVYLKQFMFLKRKQLTVMALKPHENESKFGKTVCIKREKVSSNSLNSLYQAHLIRNY